MSKLWCHSGELWVAVKLEQVLLLQRICSFKVSTEYFQWGVGWRGVCVCCGVCVRADAEKEREKGGGEREREESAPGWRRHQEIGARYSSMASSHGRSDLRFADWMTSLPRSMHTIPLTNLAIPGRFLLRPSERPCPLKKMSEFSRNIEVVIRCRRVHEQRFYCSAKFDLFDFTGCFLAANENIA